MYHLNFEKHRKGHTLSKVRTVKSTKDSSLAHVIVTLSFCDTPYELSSNCCLCFITKTVLNIYSYILSMTQNSYLTLVICYFVKFGKHNRLIYLFISLKCNNWEPVNTPFILTVILFYFKHEICFTLYWSRPAYIHVTNSVLHCWKIEPY